MTLRPFARMQPSTSSSVPTNSAFGPPNIEWRGKEYPLGTGHVPTTFQTNVSATATAATPSQAQAVAEAPDAAPATNGAAAENDLEAVVAM